MTDNMEIRAEIRALMQEVQALRMEVATMSSNQDDQGFAFPAGDFFPMGVPSGGGGGRAVKIFEVSGGDAQSGYTGKVVGESDFSTLFVPEIALGSVLLEGSRVVGHEIELPVTGGSET